MFRPSSRLIGATSAAALLAFGALSVAPATALAPSTECIAAEAAFQQAVDELEINVELLKDVEIAILAEIAAWQDVTAAEQALVDLEAQLGVLGEDVDVEAVLAAQELVVSLQALGVADLQALVALDLAALEATLAAAGIDAELTAAVLAAFVEAQADASALLLEADTVAALAAQLQVVADLQVVIDDPALAASVQAALDVLADGDLSAEDQVVVQAAITALADAGLTAEAAALDVLLAAAVEAAATVDATVDLGAVLAELDVLLGDVEVTLAGLVELAGLYAELQAALLVYEQAVMATDVAAAAAEVALDVDLDEIRELHRAALLACAAGVIVEEKKVIVKETVTVVKEAPAATPVVSKASYTG